MEKVGGQSLNVNYNVPEEGWEQIEAQPNLDIHVQDVTNEQTQINAPAKPDDKNIIQQVRAEFADKNGGFNGAKLENIQSVKSKLETDDKGRIVWHTFTAQVKGEDGKMVTKTFLRTQVKWKVAVSDGKHSDTLVHKQWVHTSTELPTNPADLAQAKKEALLLVKAYTHAMKAPLDPRHENYESAKLRINDMANEKFLHIDVPSGEALQEDYKVRIYMPGEKYEDAPQFPYKLLQKTDTVAQRTLRYGAAERDDEDDLPDIFGFESAADRSVIMDENNEYYYENEVEFRNLDSIETADEWVEWVQSGSPQLQSEYFRHLGRGVRSSQKEFKRLELLTLGYKETLAEKKIDKGRLGKVWATITHGAGAAKTRIKEGKNRETRMLKRIEKRKEEHIELMGQIDQAITAAAGNDDRINELKQMKLEKQRDFDEHSYALHARLGKMQSIQGELQGIEERLEKYIEDEIYKNGHSNMQVQGSMGELITAILQDINPAPSANEIRVIKQYQQVVSLIKENQIALNKLGNVVEKLSEDEVTKVRSWEEETERETLERIDRSRGRKVEEWEAVDDGNEIDEDALDEIGNGGD